MDVSALGRQQKEKGTQVCVWIFWMLIGPWCWTSQSASWPRFYVVVVICEEYTRMTQKDKENKIFLCFQAWNVSLNKPLPDVKYYRNIYFAFLSAAHVSFLEFGAHSCHIFLFIENFFIRGVASFKSCCCDLSGPAAELTDQMTGTWTSTSTARTSTPAESAVESLSHAVSKIQQWVLKKILWNGLFSKALIINW